MSYLIAITGGIGSGKSVVSKMLTSMGYPVYDCDSHAKALMDKSEEIKLRLCNEVLSDCVIEGKIDRKRLAEKVFKDKEALNRLNQIVHSSVRIDLMTWSRLNQSEIQFVETAILYQSGVDEMVDQVWDVDAPLDLRIERVMKRNSMSREDVIDRITSQEEFVPEKLHHAIVRLINDGTQPMLPQVEAQLCNLSRCE